MRFSKTFGVTFRVIWYNRRGHSNNNSLLVYFVAMLTSVFAATIDGRNEFFISTCVRDNKAGSFTMEDNEYTPRKKKRNKSEKKKNKSIQPQITEVF